MIPVLSLDMENPLEFIEKMGSFETVKVGHNLAIYGKKILDELYQKNLKVILDLKFCDIPSTVARSIKSWDHLAIIGFTVHSAAGIDSLKAALNSTDKLIFSVIKLTSQIGNLDDYLETIKILDNLNSSFVLPGKWAIQLRNKIKGKFLVPGIRMEIKADDQKDVITLDQVKDIANYVVLGREIYLSKNPKSKIEKIKEELKCQ
ncbi:orotidine 5'-phosphate decarboxylase [Thermosipho melanesiensis]|uniref:Orotidine 5'-phosphate decarboxylase n=2 Tax=Thermosipho melanesiensis TaxID=46541 RepID=A6LJP1_THEM4|nr:orotidine-5'-phosphate decarboxylase [Thermosipho melanesiensis]ABR30142.1 orotidine 5'-phosphate decarboxylase [Thermosipho melanesiensis BI429]APT73339.1 orotidine 5'-phosphate decarboxylase [Thermosipho melanesiensis]OOC38727.1 orotidine 5'-phosphate decarboxylase [Thermosipho melanesiensis]OOC40532.1 orotidine 5'-phosphate decarboxylase [Thermosipho melanesiensis]OOC40796.1 orotidine 5'-phosphate decarboxylase [Thermosipho melanesiensis]